MREDDAIGLLHEMAQRNIFVEICLTSNDTILGVSGQNHPFPVYRKFGVPVAFSTDDEGVSRSDMTQEYLRGTQTYGLSYADLKEMARQSLEHSFLPGDSLWSDTKVFNLAAPCAGAQAANLSAVCQTFLNNSEKARTQWKLEEEFARFEAKN
jgi:adenosine deaminase